MMELQELARLLGEIKNPVSDAWLVNRVVSSLPSEYRPFKKSWASISATTQTPEALLARFKNEELKKRVENESNPEDVETTKAFYAQGNRQQKDKKEQGGTSFTTHDNAMPSSSRATQNDNIAAPIPAVEQVNNHVQKKNKLVDYIPEILSSKLRDRNKIDQPRLNLARIAQEPLTSKL
ncbi:unnamed protein product [Allacma fusca]|uniref:Uncharacterized protein n=1 Tax=Allacma fusca TaxID=39272 RepID=A0A8J2L4B3_9HEXA|nr:unnamed protein product [Allacma fusca]